MTNIDDETMSKVFNEWAKRYSEHPEEFGNVLGSDGKPVEDYGDSCTIYFKEIFADLTKERLNV